MILFTIAFVWFIFDDQLPTWAMVTLMILALILRI